MEEFILGLPITITYVFVDLLSIADGDMLREHNIPSRTSKSTVLKALLKSSNASIDNFPSSMLNLMFSITFRIAVIVL